ncbi:hypothetical protein C8R44DRAFT_892797 [Mycena epipterygia]|nr:hypothetical protein C8R44DRAFT_892797 [Mycena epipterygia]
MFYAPIGVVVVLTFIYSGLAFAAFYRRKRTFASFLRITKSAFTTRHYVPLMVITIVLAVWEANVSAYPSVFIPPNAVLWNYIAWWIIPPSAYSFFCFFSFGDDAVAEYGPWCQWMARGVSPLASCVSRIAAPLRIREDTNTSFTASSTSSAAHLAVPEIPSTSRKSTRGSWQYRLRLQVDHRIWFLALALRGCIMYLILEPGAR